MTVPAALNIQVPATIRPGAKITFLGEAPGDDEVWLKEGFVGPAGKILELECGMAGVALSQCNKTNVVKCKLPKNDFGIMYDGKRDTAELITWKNLLREELIRTAPNVVVACGNNALRAVTGMGEITKRQGSVYQSTLVPGLKVVPLLHPSSILQGQQWQNMYITARLMQKVVIPESWTHTHDPRPWEQILAPTLEDIWHEFSKISEERRRWCIDIETRGGSISCVGIGSARGLFTEERALVVPIQTTKGAWFTPEDEWEFWRLLQGLSNSNPDLVLQNAVFDLDWLMEYGFVPSAVLLDTMTLHHHMHPELPKSLQLLNVFYPTGIPFYKDEGKTWGSKTPNEQEWNYNAKDLISTLRISFQEEMEARDLGLLDQYNQESLPNLATALEMQWHGLPADDAKIAWTRELVQKDAVRLQMDLDKTAGWPVNINSPKDVPKFLYQQLGYPYLYGKKNADEDVLVTLKSWAAGQPVTNHTKFCDFGKKPCKHLPLGKLELMKRGLEYIMRLRKLKKALSSYLAPGIFCNRRPTI